MHRSVLSELYMSLKKITHVLIALILNEAMLKPAKISLNSPAHKEHKNLLFDVHRFNKTKATGTYLRCSRNKVFYHDFVDETEFVSGYTDRYWDKTIS